MTRIVDLPFSYPVIGVLPGRRTCKEYLVTEVASFEIGDDVASDGNGTLHRHEVPFHGGRPWLPVRGVDQEAITDVEGLATVAAAAVRPQGPRVGMEVYGNRSMTTEDWAVQEFCAVASVAPWRVYTNANTDPQIEVPAGRAWTTLFRRVDWDARSKALATMAGVAGHLRFVDGELRTDRFEVFCVTRDGEVVESKGLCAFDRLDPAVGYYLHPGTPPLGLGARYKRSEDLMVPYRAGPGFSSMAYEIDPVPGCASAVGKSLEKVGPFLARSLEGQVALAELAAVHAMDEDGSLPDYDMARLHGRLVAVRDALEEARHLGGRPEFGKGVEESLLRVCAIQARLVAVEPAPRPQDEVDMRALMTFTP